MRNKLKIGLVGAVVSVILSGCFKDSPENVVENYVSGYNTVDFNKVYKSLSSAYKADFSEGMIIKCQRNKFKREAISKLNNEGIDSKILNILNYHSFSSEEKYKAASFCFNEVMKNEIKNNGIEKVEILNSEIFGKSAKVEVKQTIGTDTNMTTIKLQKENEEWVITEI